jgi:AraC-like DNA-binding protein
VNRMTPAPREDPRGAAERLARRIEALASPNTMTPTRAPGLTIYASTLPAHRMHLVYRPSLCVVAQGEKCAHVADQVFHYDAARFFFTAVPLPAELEVRGTTGPPLLGLVLELELELVARIALEIDDVPSPSDRDAATAGVPGVAFTGALTPPLADTLERLVGCAVDEVRHHVLYRGVLREVVFELLVGAEGGPLRRALRQYGRLRALIDSARYIDEHFHEPLSVPLLARRAGMSESAFFSRFRQATGTSPLQYLKRIRLVKARALLATGAQSVTEAAFAVGYTSSSQFSREFRAAFGSAPSGQLRSNSA